MYKLVALLMLVTVVAANGSRFRSSRFRSGGDANVATPAAGPRSKFCGRHSCPKYTTVTTTDNYEERTYDAASWVSTSLVGMDYRQSSYTMFMRIFDYIKGANANNQRISMTIPVKRRVNNGAEPECGSNFTMSFFVDPKEGVPPTPTDQEVFVENLQPTTVFVKVFGGFARTCADWSEKALELQTALQADGKDFVSEYYYTAGYDSPWKRRNRHNEVWFLKK